MVTNPSRTISTLHSGTISGKNFEGFYRGSYSYYNFAVDWSVVVVVLYISTSCDYDDGVTTVTLTTTTTATITATTTTTNNEESYLQVAETAVSVDGNRRTTPHRILYGSNFTKTEKSSTRTTTVGTKIDCFRFKNFQTCIETFEARYQQQQQCNVFFLWLR